MSTLVAFSFSDGNENKISAGHNFDGFFFFFLSYAIFSLFLLVLLLLCISYLHITIAQLSFHFYKIWIWLHFTIYSQYSIFIYVSLIFISCWKLICCACLRSFWSKIYGVIVLFFTCRIPVYTCIFNCSSDIPNPYTVLIFQVSISVILLNKRG